MAPVIGVLLAAAGLAAAEPRVEVKLGQASIYEGESVGYIVTVLNVDNPTRPQLEGFDDFNVASLGERSLNARSITIINGRRTETVRYGRAYSFRLTPLKTGILRVPAPLVDVLGHTIKGEELLLEVTAPQQQDLLVLEIKAEPEAVYPLQPFTVTLSVLVKGLGVPNEKVDPVSIRAFSRHLTIPWVDDDSLPTGMKPARPWRRWLGALQNGSGVGFAVNNIAQQSTFFSLLDERPRALCFCPQPRKIRRPNDAGIETEYWQYDFQRTFVPRRIGDYTFGPVTFKGRIATGAGARGQALGSSIYAVSPAVTVTCKDVPIRGRPDSYVGAVGDFKLASKLTPKRVKVGDPMTLTLTLSGTGTLADAFAPDLVRVGGVAENFKIYEAAEESQGNSREFTYSLRPKKEGIAEFPSIPVSYFDVNAEKYVTLRTNPVQIEVSKAVRLSGAQIVAARRGGSTNGDDVELSRQGLFHNVTDLTAVRDRRVHPGRWLASLAAMAGIYAAVAGVTWQVRRRSGNTALRRRRTAAATARTRLQAARDAFGANRLRDAADGIRAAVVGMVADMIDLPDGGTTPREIERELRSLGVDQALRDRLHALLATCDAARYGASSAAPGGLGQEAEGLLAALRKELKRKKRLRE